MANPQTEDGYVKIANEIVEALAVLKTPMSFYEWKILMFIFRKTYGWGKKEDVIALSQFSVGTGIKVQHVCRAIKKMVSRNIITQTGNGYHVKYSFQKNHELWDNPLPKQVTINQTITQTGTTQTGNEPLPKQVIGVTQTGSSSLPEQGDTKDTTKTTLTKERKKGATPGFDFETLWNRYPEKDGKIRAKKCFEASIKTEDDYISIQAALSNYLKSRKVQEGYVKNGDTWFYNWRDWISTNTTIDTDGIPEEWKTKSSPKR